MNPTIRLADVADVPALQSVFATVEVSRWWPGMDTDALTELVADPDLVVWVVEVEGEVVGLAQVYEEDDPQYRHAGIDLALHPDVHGQGVGPTVIGIVVQHLLEDGHHRVVIDPNAANARAIRAYEKAGFRRVGVMRAYEWDAHLGRWSDGLLMEWVIPDQGSPDRSGR